MIGWSLDLYFYYVYIIANNYKAAWRLVCSTPICYLMLRIGKTFRRNQKRKEATKFFVIFVCCVFFLYLNQLNCYCGDCLQVKGSIRIFVQKWKQNPEEKKTPFSSDFLHIRTLLAQRGGQPANLFCAMISKFVPKWKYFFAGSCRQGVEICQV